MWAERTWKCWVIGWDGTDDGEDELKSPPPRSAHPVFLSTIFLKSSKSIHSCHLHTHDCPSLERWPLSYHVLGTLNPFQLWKSGLPWSSWRLLAQSGLLLSEVDSFWHTKVICSTWLFNRYLCARTCHNNAKLLHWGNPTMFSMDIPGKLAWQDGWLPRI